MAIQAVPGKQTEQLRRAGFRIFHLKIPNPYVNPTQEVKKSAQQATQNDAGKVESKE